jgi:hypothetical protein
MVCCIYFGIFGLNDCFWLLFKNLGDFLSYHLVTFSDHTQKYKTILKSRCLYYKTFYCCNCCRSAISESVCHCQTLPPKSNICRQGLESTNVELLSRLYSNGRLLGWLTDIRLAHKRQTVKTFKIIRI